MERTIDEMFCDRCGAFINYPVEDVYELQNDINIGGIQYADRSKFKHLCKKCWEEFDVFSRHFFANPTHLDNVKSLEGIEHCKAIRENEGHLLDAYTKKM